jgi:HPt (histidine-containing phosphotransfer) domain-containing protein
MSYCRTCIEGSKWGDANLVFQSAHSLKSSSLDAGAHRLGTQAASLEQRSRAGDLDGAADSLVSIENEFTRVRLALQAAIHSPHDSDGPPGEAKSRSVE